MSRFWKSLGEIGPIDAQRLNQARRLFAKAIETPGGLKIQTIHSFCAGLLRRFPLEAKVPHNFAEMDDRAGSLMRAEVVEEMANGGDIAAVDALAQHYTGKEIASLLAELSRNSAAFLKEFSQEAARELFGLRGDFSEADAVDVAFDGSETALFEAVIPVLQKQSATMVELATFLAGIDTQAPTYGDLQALWGALLLKNSSETKIKSIPTKNAVKALGDVASDFHAFMERIGRSRESILALAAAKRTWALYRFARAYLTRYQMRKLARGWLDFDDLIERAATLLSDPSVAQWVLFRLDGGIDHILVDEAQDTSPGQWRVIVALADEFTAGEGARSFLRTIFVVGDQKQSIYSFQGADLTEFDRMRREFAQKFDAAGRPLQRLDLEHSFRSASVIMRLVDVTFDEPAQRGLGGPTKHIAFYPDMPGRVDLWPPVLRPGKADMGNWEDPVDLRGAYDEKVVLAQQIASEIRHMIDSGVQIPTREGVRGVHEGDFLILVQRRSGIFLEIIRACKSLGLVIAGADRLKLGAEIAVRDIGSVLAFLATPEDDLSLAEALKSPLFGWTEAELYALAQPRQGYLWEALRADESHPQTLAVLDDLRSQVDFLRPFELIERLLTRHSGRERLVARLGAEAEDGIDELLSQALAFERSEIPSLTGFLSWLSVDDVEIKRQLGVAGRAIRVMTVHGAKGLESPIVILPDTGVRGSSANAEVYQMENGQLAWRTAAAESPAVAVQAQERLLQRLAEERMRLLYVAMTRAEKWLIVCAAGDVGEADASWYSLVAQGMQRASTEPHFIVETRLAPIGEVVRLSCGEWPAPTAPQAPTRSSQTILPEWVHRRPAAAVADLLPLSPSDLGGAKALAGNAAPEDEAKRRGTQLHLLLQHLPAWSPEDWSHIGASLLSTGEAAANSAEIESLLADAGRVMAAPELQEFFSVNALAEAEFTVQLPQFEGRPLHGTVDRLLIGAERIRVLDFKSNIEVPKHPDDVPEGILRQMGAYAAALREIYPERAVDVALFWTASGYYMPLPAELIAAALNRTASP
jgi:ATP-dependent helicase/nuclease subunit A